MSHLWPRNLRKAGAFVVLGIVMGIIITIWPNLSGVVLVAFLVIAAMSTLFSSNRR